MECLIKPLRQARQDLLDEYDAFFTSPIVTKLPLDAPVFDRAAAIRAAYRYSTTDALHLAAAVEGNCDAFLTNDGRLAGFPDLGVLALP